MKYLVILEIVVLNLNKLNKNLIDLEVWEKILVFIWMEDKVHQNYYRKLILLLNHNYNNNYNKMKKIR